MCVYVYHIYKSNVYNMCIYRIVKVASAKKPSTRSLNWKGSCVYRSRTPPLRPLATSPALVAKSEHVVT